MTKVKLSCNSFVTSRTRVEVSIITQRFSGPRLDATRLVPPAFPASNLAAPKPPPKGTSNEQFQEHPHYAALQRGNYRHAYGLFRHGPGGHGTGRRHRLPPPHHTP